MSVPQICHAYKLQGGAPGLASSLLTMVTTHSRGEMATLSMYIKVGSSQQVIKGLRQEDNVEDVVRWLCQRNNLRGQHLLLEIWKGCTSPLHPKEKLVESILNWGPEIRHVTFKLASSKSFIKSKRGNWSKRKQRNQRKSRVIGRCRTLSGRLRVSVRHSIRHRANCKSHRQHKQNLMIRRLNRAVKKLNEELKDLQIQVRDEETGGEKRSDAEAVSFLNPYLQGEYISSKNKLSKAKQMKKDLEKHKKELEQTISNRQSEILSLETNVEGTQEKIDQEKKLLDQQPPNIQDNHEFQVTSQKLEDLENRLKAKQKISELQSSKIQDLFTEKSKLENLLQDCEDSIRLLRLQTYKEDEYKEMV